jgi:hypothetical protein
VKDLTLDDILAADDLHVTPVEVPEWGGRVHVRMLKADEAVRFSDALSGADATAAILELVALCCTSAAGKRLFASAAQVATKGFEGVKRVHAAAATLNKLHRGADEEKKDSPPAPTGGSPTA